MNTTVSLHVNGERHDVQVPPHETLLRLLRDRLALVGTKQGCDSGGCGCCTVLVDGASRYACMTYVHSVAGCKVTTIEGLSQGTQLDRLQAAFVTTGAVQCGYCTCGIIMAAKQLLDRVPDPDEVTIRQALAGNLCRCTGYHKIVAAVKLAATGKPE
jgi:carbon-monoxide dehydrogenase small subunit